MSKTIFENRILFSGIRTSSNSSSDLKFLSLAGAAYLSVTDSGGTAPILNVFIEELDPISGLYFVIATFTQATGTTNERKEIPLVAGNKIRARWVITGSAGQTFTFSISVNGKYIH